MRKLTTAAILGLLLTGCSTVNYKYSGRACSVQEETYDEVTLKCPKVVHFDSTRNAR